MQLMWGVGTMRDQGGEAPLQPTSGYFCKPQGYGAFFFFKYLAGRYKNLTYNIVFSFIWTVCLNLVYSV